MNGAPHESHSWWRRGLAVVAGRGGDTLLRLAIFPATALVLPRADFSVYALLTATLGTAQALFALGGPRAAVFFHRRGERGPLFAWLLVLAFVPGAAAAAILLAWPAVRAFWFGAVPAPLFWVGVAPLPFLLLADSLSAILLASHRERAYAFFLWSRTAGAGLVVLTALAAGDRLAWILWGRLLVQGFTVAGLFAVVGARPSWRRVGGFAGAAFRFGAPVAAASALGALHRRGDVFLLSAFGRTAEIGGYALAYAIAETLWILTDSLDAALFVELSGLPGAEARTVASRALGRFAALALGGGLAILAGGETILFVVFGARYPTAPLLLPVVLAGVALWGAARPAGSFLFASGRGSAMAVLQGLALVLNLALCALLIPTRGAAGAAWATLASYSAIGLGARIVFGRAARPRPSA
jgi:O-antigen/teichoic acid export membrane protein